MDERLYDTWQTRTKERSRIDTHGYFNKKRKCRGEPPNGSQVNDTTLGQNTAAHQYGDQSSPAKTQE